ncbi:MAG: polysaccharide biosynthesis C-terminal domain-containing protein [archaeon]|nr:polysaccharide biosynthesis C-terminal domain-containing protein [archaeon]
MSEYVRFIQRIGLVGLTNILISLSSLIFIPIITKSFTTAEYGMWAQVNTTIALVPNIANLGLPFTMVRFLSAEKDKDKIRESFYPMMAVTFTSTIIICGIFIILGNPIANALFNGSMQVLYITTIISFFACMNLMLISYFRTFQQMKRYSLYQILQSYIGVFVSIYLTYAGYPIETVVLGLLTGYVAVFIIMWVPILKYLGFGSVKWSNLKEQLEFAIPTIPSNVSSWIVDSSDKYIIGIFAGPIAVGCYSPGYALGSILLMFLTPFAVLLPAVLPEPYEKGDIKQVDTYLNYSMKYYLLLTVPAAVGMSVLSKPLLLVITTPEIALGGYMITPLVCLGALFMGMYGITNNILILDKNTKLLGKLWIVVAISNIVLNIILVPYLGIIGAGFATLLCYILAFVVTAVASKKLMKLPFNLKEMLKIIIASGIMGVIIYLINPNRILGIILAILIGIVIYFVIIFLLKGISKKEIQLFKDLI